MASHIIWQQVPDSAYEEITHEENDLFQHKFQHHHILCLKHIRSVIHDVKHSMCVIYRVILTVYTTLGTWDVIVQMKCTCHMLRKMKFCLYEIEKKVKANHSIVNKNICCAKQHWDANSVCELCRHKAQQFSFKPLKARCD